ncbi:MAG: peptidylprolyl isomerase [Bacteroidota bacterium]
MIKQWTMLLTLISLTIGGLFAQEKDARVLFSVEDDPVTVEEFTYIYSKTNGEQADFSEASLQEYLDLYVKFKLKVQRAKEMRLDTITALQDELAGYRRQLADSYLIDRAIGDQLIQDAYNHTTQDADISHILINMRKDPQASDTLAAYKRAMEVYDRIQKGDDFATVAKELSGDRFSREKGGRIGFTTALYPAGLHALEYAAFKQDIGIVSKPIRTQAGYHLLKVHERRPARGEIEVAHILVRTDKRESETAKILIDSLYRQLGAGANFEQLARNASEDGRTANNNGYLGFFGISRYERAFEDAAFALTEDGAYTAPVETTLGWHIIKRISRKEIQPFQTEKARLEGKVRQDARFEEAKKALLVRIRTENNFAEQTAVLDNYIASLPDTFTTFRWKAPAQLSQEALFSLDGGFQVTLGDLQTYYGKATRDRVTYAREGNKDEVARRLYATFVDDQLLKYEEAQLEKRYPEFRNLMREYEEGILLFEATKMEVWDKASQDSVGLAKFFEGVAGKYRWAPRAKTTVYRISTNYKDQAEAIRAFAATHTAEEVKAEFNSDEQVKVVTEEVTYEKFRNTDLSETTWEVGGMTGVIENERSRSLKFFKIEELMPEGNKSLKEARGYVIADYQDQLERQWVDELRRSYKVNIDQKVFRSLIR